MMNHSKRNNSKKGGKALLTKLLLPFFVLGGLLLSGCTIHYQVPVTSIDIQEDNIFIPINEQETLTYNISPTNATNKNVSWSSAQESVATVDENGQITGVSEGETVITVTTEDGHFTADCLVNVVARTVNVSSVSLNQNAMDLYVSDVATLNFTILPSDASNQNVTWSSSNTSVATISNGTVTALSAGTAIMTVTTQDGGFTDTCLLTVKADEILLEETIDSNANFSYGNYDANFGTDYYNNVKYGFYRVTDDYIHNGMITLYPSTDNYDYHALPGAFFNDTQISGIKKITVSYISTGGLVINYGPTKTRGYSQTIATTGTSNWITTTITCSVTSRYFSLETNNRDAYIKSIVIGYNSSLSDDITTVENNDYRITPTVYNGSLQNGVSSVSVPDDITITGSTYTINSYKTYTYYSFDYVSSHSGSLDLSSIAMTDPVDVANYYIAFHAIPANYGGNVSEACGSVSEVNSLFGTDAARKISQYNRTDGYANAVPWNPQDGESTPLYYEFDIALNNSYSTSSRGVGRVVMWIYGWSCYNDDAPVAVYTDDHYATFSEYLNDGDFGARFDSQTSSDGYRTGHTNLQGSIQLA